MFIGSEGTLGVITGVSLLTPPRPKSVHVAFLACESFEKVLTTFKRAKSELGEILSAIEFLDRPSMELVIKHHADTSDPFQQQYPLYMLIETAGSNEAHDEEKLNTFLESLMSSDDSPILDGTVAQQTAQMQKLWKLRENISESLQRDGVVYKYDVSLPLTNFYDMVTDMRKRIGERGKVVGYGHVGDGNLHLNISTPQFDKGVFQDIEPYVYEWTSSKRGSISAEHGLGVMKPEFLHYSKAEPVVDVMRSMKQALDPNGILNPYKVLPRK